MKISTIQLQTATAKAIKGAGGDKSLLITTYIGLKCRGNELTLVTTDGSNYLYVTATGDTDEFDISVDAEKFSRLIAKITSEYITLEVTESYLYITGNGSYKIELQADDDGDGVFKFMDIRPSEPKDVKRIGDLTTADINIMLTSLKLSLPKKDESVYSYYYVGETIATTDRCMLCSYDKNIFTEKEELLFTREFVDLLGLAVSDVVLSECGNYIVAEDTHITVCARKIKNEGYNVAGLHKILSLDFNSFCRVNKNDIMGLLERLAIFVTDYDDGAIYLNFTDNALEFSSINSSGVESIEYKECKDATDLSVKVNIKRLITQLKAYQSDVVDIYYGQDKFVKLSDGKLTQVLAYML